MNNTYNWEKTYKRRDPLVTIFANIYQRKFSFLFTIQNNVHFYVITIKEKKNLLKTNELLYLLVFNIEFYLPLTNLAQFHEFSLILDYGILESFRNFISKNYSIPLCSTYFIFPLILFILEFFLTLVLLLCFVHICFKFFFGLPKNL